MLNSKKYEEDGILMDLSKHEAVWQEVFQQFRLDFVILVEKKLGIRETDALVLLTEAFSNLRLLVGEGRIQRPLNKSLFQYILEIADRIHRKKQGKEGRTNWPEKAGEYLASDILLALIRKGFDRATSLLYQIYQEGAQRIAYSEGRPFSAEAFQIAFIALTNNILKGTLKPPMTSKLFTYFMKIFRRVRPPKPPVKIVFDPRLHDKADEPDLGSEIIIGDKDLLDLLVHMISLLDELPAEILLLRYFYLEGEITPHKEIAKLLNIPANRSQQRLFAASEKLRVLLLDMHANQAKWADVINRVIDEFKKTLAEAEADRARQREMEADEDEEGKKNEKGNDEKGEDDEPADEGPAPMQ